MDFIILLLIIFFLVGVYISYKIGHDHGSFRRDKYWEGEIPNYRKDAIMKSRAILGGQFSEQLAPYFPNFNYLPTECRFLGKPIDFICFKGMDKKKIEEVVFIEVKSGRSNLTLNEKNLKEAIEKKRVRWEEYRVSEDLTKRDDSET